MRSLLFSEKSLQTILTVCKELNIEVPKNGTVESDLFPLLTTKFDTIDKSKLTKVQRAVFNTVLKYNYANNRQYRITVYTESKPGVCEMIKLAGINATKKNPVNVKQLALQVAKKYNKTVDKMIKRVLSQFTYYMFKEHNVVMKTDDNKQTFYCVNPDYAKQRLNK